MPVYPGYVIFLLLSVLSRKPVKWIEITGENKADSFARDYHIKVEIAAALKQRKDSSYKIQSIG